MTKKLRHMTAFILGLMFLSLSSVSFGFEYGQCLLGRADSFNAGLKEYRNVALAKAAIKKLALQQNPDLLKWNYQTTRFVYDLVTLHTDLIRLNNVYQSIRATAPDKIETVQKFFDGSSGHVALAHVDEAHNPENQGSFTELIDLLASMVINDSAALKEIESIRASIEKDWVRDALGDLYDRLQEASVGATPVEPQTIEQWIHLAAFFKGRIISTECNSCAKIESSFWQVISDWERLHQFPSEDEFSEISKRLPPLLKIRYPKLSQSSGETNKALGYFYLRTMEDFLFSRNSIKLEYVENWIKKDPNYAMILNQANKYEEFKDESSKSVKIYKYIMSKARVLGNAFDHFVWKGQQGTDLEKSIDGVARTLYGEVESCQIAGAHQFEAIGSIIAARSISVDRENRDNNIFQSVLNFGIDVVNVVSPIEIAHLSPYKKGASDFGRNREATSNPIVTQMATPAQVVSRPGQFAVWKIGSVQKLELSRWVQFPPKLDYPNNLKINISGPVGKDMDPAQRKVLCPNHEIFKEAVTLAKELVTDYYSYSNKYQFHQKDQRVYPYFYTHGIKTRLNFARQIQPKPLFSRIGDHAEGLPLYEGNSACTSFKVYQPKYFKVSSKSTSKNANASTKKSKLRFTVY